MIFLKKHFTFSAIILSMVFLAGCGPVSTATVEQYDVSAQHLTVGQYDALAQHLTESGFKIYGTSWCSACKMQKDLFGSSFQYINYEECSLDTGSGQTEVCIADGIKAYPTWQFHDGTKKAGFMTIEQLKETSGFKS